MKESSSEFEKIDVKDVHITGGLLAHKYQTVIENVIPYQWLALNDEVEDADPSHALANFRIAAGWEDGEFAGMVFQDSDVAKWLEAVAYQLAVTPDDELKGKADGVIDIIAQAQEENGYLNTYFQLKEPEAKWTNLTECHELYCAGHMLEAAVAYYEATGERKLLDVMVKYVDLIDSLFGREESKIHGYPGHQEIELALMRLYGITGNDRHLKLASYFIDERGTEPNFFTREIERRAGKTHWPNFHENNHLDYNQAHLPVRDQKVAVGHAVRAVYMYSAMADIARERDDAALAEACRTLWANVTEKQMYITGGIGSSDFQEAFTIDYDIPNDRAYNETCASIGLMFWAQRMIMLDGDARYADVMERAFYNGILSGMSEDGKKFFYVNPLEVVPSVCDKRDDMKHVEPVRQKWFTCACCPPNIARLLASLGQYIYLKSKDSLWVNLYGDSRVKVSLGGTAVLFEQKGNYPWDGNVHMSLSMEDEADFTLKIRIPQWCGNDWTLTVNGEAFPGVPEKGYVEIKRIWKNGDSLALSLEMKEKRIYTNSNVGANAGKVALMKGPVVYCLEEADNGSHLSSLILRKDGPISSRFRGDLLGGVNVLTAEGFRERSVSGRLYGERRPEREEAEMHFIPYFAWNNRGKGELLVWVRE